MIASVAPGGAVAVPLTAFHVPFDPGPNPLVTQLLQASVLKEISMPAKYVLVVRSFMTQLMLYCAPGTTAKLSSAEVRMVISDDDVTLREPDAGEPCASSLDQEM